MRDLYEDVERYLWCALGHCAAWSLGGRRVFCAQVRAGSVRHAGTSGGTITAITSIVALLVSLIIAGSIRRTSQQNKANLLHAENVATYQLFADMWASLLQYGRGPEEGNSSKLSTELQALDCFLTLYGSPGVIKAHAVLRALARASGAQNPQVRSQFAKALLEIRKDLGSKMQSLTAEELEQFIFAEAGKVSASSKASAYRGRQARVYLASKS